MGVVLWLISVLMSLEQASGVSDAWNVALPDVVLGLHGSCVLVPCHFTIPRKLLLNCSNRDFWRVRVLDGVGSRSASSQYRLVQDMKSYNCTTVLFRLSEERTHIFHLRLDCSELTLTKEANISLQRAPPPPQLDAMHQLLEGQLAELRCSVPVPCPALPPSITWLPQDDVVGQQTRLQHNENQLMTLTSTLTFIPKANHHNRSITCSASYPLLNGSILGPSASTLVLSVQYAPRSTQAKLLRSGSDGRTLTLTCSSDANPPVSVYTWHRVSGSGQLIRKGQGKVMILTVARLGGGAFLCEAKNAIGSQRSRLVLLASASTGSSVPAQILCVLCGVLFLLYLLMVGVNVHVYQRISRRMKQIEVQKEHIYINLRQDAVVSEYSQIQRPEAAAPSSNVPDYVIPLPN